jgi:hypothetical protein
MFRNSSLVELVELLVSRSVYLYHACQYGDFVSYLRLGGIPSRQQVEKAGLFLTPFTTDGTDRENRVWDKVFVNLDDFGRGFARGWNAVPNAYGPIVVRLHPGALLDAADAAVCLRSAGARGFDREAECLASVDEVDRVFYDPREQGRGTARLKFGDALRQTFGPRAEAVEVSCTFPTGVLPFAYAVDAMVDPYLIDGTELARHVDEAVRRSRVPLAVVRRSSVRRSERYDLLLGAIRTRTPSIREFAEHVGDDQLRAWARTIAERGGILEKNFTRYADYLRIGTLEQLPRSRIPLLPSFIDYAPSLGDDFEEEWDDDDTDWGDDERDLITAELDEYREDWARDRDEGWFYADADGEDEWSSEEAEQPWE